MSVHNQKSYGSCTRTAGNCFLFTRFPHVPHLQPHHFLSLGMSRNVTEQLEICSSEITTTDKERAIYSSLENTVCPVSVWVFVELLTFEEQFKLKYGRSACRPVSVPAIPITETCKADTFVKETKDAKSVKTTTS